MDWSVGFMVPSGEDIYGGGGGGGSGEGGVVFGIVLFWVMVLVYSWFDSRPKR